MIRAICCLAAIVSVVSAQRASELQSPCPEVFMYEPSRSGEKSGSDSEKWYGVVNLSTDITLYALWLNIILDNKADILGNWVGEVTTEDNYNFKIENTKMTISPGSPTAVRFFVQYNTGNAMPRLQSILFNGREICNKVTTQTTEDTSIYGSNNYDINNGIPTRYDKVTTTARSITTTKTKNHYIQKTTTKSNYWTQAKVETTQATTTEKLQTKSESKGKLTSNIWSWVAPQTKNTQETKTVSNQETKSKDQTLANNSQPKSQWSQNKSENSNSKQTSSSETQSVNRAQSGQEIRQQSIGQLWAQTKATNNQQTKAEIIQTTTERNKQATYDSTTYSKLQTWSAGNAGNYQQVVTENNQQVWSPSRVEGNQQTKPTNTQTRTDGSYQATSGNQYYSQSNTGNNQQTTANNAAGSYVDNSYVEAQNTQQRKPIDALPIRDEGTLQDRPIRRKESSNTYSYTQDQSKVVNEYTDSRNNNDRTGLSDRNLQQQSSLNGQQLTVARPTTPAVVVPIVEGYYSDTLATEDEDDSDDGLGLPIFIPNYRPDNTCGKVTKKPPLYLPYGSTTSEGQWPWQAALYQQRTVDFKYICGGTLVSHRHILTAAHCVTRKNSLRVVNQNTLTVYLGKFNLRTSVDGVQVKFVKKIILHPEYNATTFSRDLAILELREAAMFTDWVRPACLWPENRIGRRHIIGKKGSVVGWGFEMTGAPKAELSLLEMPVVDQETCISSFTEYYQRFISEYTYCAGYTDGSTICNGDSGGGMVFKRGSTWYLRGLASLSVARPNENRCDPNRYVIFTDLAKFLPWIEEHVD